MKTRTLWLALNLLLVAAASGADSDKAPPASNTATGAPRPAYKFVLPDFTALVAGEGPAVVNIHVFKAPASDRADTPPAQAKRTSGSGFVVAPNGVILTNQHVVAGASKVTVKFIDKRELPARVIGVDALTDIAVLKVDASDLPSVTLGDSSRLAVGQWVLAIGAPLGLERTATQGIISALGRSLPNDSYVPFIQTDVPINPGNSGGPLFDLEGRVVGINAQIVSNSGGYMGLSFAIPINTAIDVAKQILAQGHATHGWLGASAQDISQELARAYSMDDPRGALLNDISPGSPAERAGLQTGDIILAMDDLPIVDSADLPPRIGASQPGNDHVLNVLRDGKVNRINIRIGELGAGGTASKRAPSFVKNPRLGLQLADMDDASRQVLGLHAGVLVGEVAAGPASIAGVQPGDILLKLDRYPMENVAQAQAIIAKLASNQPVPLLIKRQDDMLFVAINLPEVETH